MRFPKANKCAGVCLTGAFVFLLFGGFIFPWMIWSRGRVEAMTQWPEIDARVVSAETRSTYRRPAGRRYRHEINYQFEVESRSYTGDRETYGGSSPEWHSEAEARDAQPAIGSTVRIRYNPDAPGDSVMRVIRTSDSHALMLRWFVGGVGAAGGLLMIAGAKAWGSGRK
ncbi:MAG TPA: DUF3592 domain-containing protein [Opitutaceae bacterium]|nr:DUF3592 domain-containing protein [Opitutaceae bacterium]